MANPYTRYGQPDDDIKEKNYGTKSTGKTKRSNPYTSYGARDEEEDTGKADRAAAAKRLAEQYKKEGKKPDGSNKSLAETMGDIMGGVGKAAGAAGNFLVDTGNEVVKSARGTLNTIGTGLGHVVDDVTGESDRRFQQHQSSQDETQRLLMEQIRKKNDTSLSQAERDKAAKSAASYSSLLDQSEKSFQGSMQQKIAETDPIKQAGATTELAATIASLGVGGAVKAAGTGVAKTIAKEAGKDSVLGGVIGAAETARTKGSEATAKDYAISTGIGAGIGAVAGGVTGGLGARAEKKAAQKLLDEEAAARQADVPAEVIPEQKLLGEPGRDFYAPEGTAIKDELDRLNANDLDYMRENGFISSAKDDGRLAQKLMENPEVAKQMDELSLKVVDAEDQVEYYNDLRLKSPYFRQVDRVEAKRQEEIDHLRAVADENGSDPADVEQLATEINKRYDEKLATLDAAYPVEALEKPALEAAQLQASQARLEAQAELERVKELNFQTVKESGGLLEQPDVEKLTARKQQLETRQAEIDNNIAQAEARRTAPPKSAGDVEAKMTDLQNGLHPKEHFNPDGTLNKERVKASWKQLQDEREVKLREDAHKAIEDTKPMTPELKEKAIEETAASLQMPKKTINNATSIFQTPTRLLRKVGLGDLSDTIETSFSGYRRGLAKASSDIRTLQGETKLNKQSKERVADALNGKDVVLDSTEQRVVDSLRDMFKKYADELGLPEERRIANYFPHMYDQLGKDKSGGVPIELQSILNKKFDPKTKAGNIDKSRLADDEAFIKDPFKVAAAYAQQAERRIHMQPAFEEMNKYITDDGVDKKITDYLQNYGSYLKGDQQAIDKLLDHVTGGVGSNVATGVRNTAYRANLQMNLGSAIRNLTQGTNTITEIGVSRYVQGSLKMTKVLAKAADDARKGIPNKDFIEMNEMGVFDDTFHQDGEIAMVKRTLERFDKVGWAMFNATEKLNRGTAYLGAKAKYLAKHKGDEEGAKKYAAEMVSKTQFHFNQMDTPPILRSKTSKALMQYQSFNVKQGEYLVDLAKGAGKGVKNTVTGKATREDVENMAKAMRWVGANLAMTGVLGGLLGVKFTDMIPNPTDPRNYGSPILQLMFGDGKGGSGIAQVVTGAQDPNKKMYDEEGNEVTDPMTIRLANAGSFIQKTLPAVTVPWISQGKKTAEGVQAVKQGYSETDSGNIRFQIEDNDSNRTQAALFGQYTLPEAREFYSDKSNTNLSPSASEKVKAAPVGEEDQYYTFYSAANKVNGRTKANQEITKLIQDGQVSKARRKAEEFNAKVDSKMAAYYAKYPDMDLDLQEELNSNLYINLTTRSEKQRARQ